MRRLEITRTLQAIPPPSSSGKLWRVIRDEENPDWDFASRTIHPDFNFNLGQAPSVYGYSSDQNYKPNDYHVQETGLEAVYYALNDFNTAGVQDGLGRDRCENFLFKDDTALYNGNAEGDRGFPRRELLTMSNNLLEEIGWETGTQNRRYLKFKTVKPGDILAGMTHQTHPQFVHQFFIVQFRDGQTVTNPKINRNGYIYYYLISKSGYGYMPERYVKAI